MKFNKSFHDKLKLLVSSQYPMARIMAVTKNRPTEIIEQIISEGQRLFGENKLQEAEKKFTTLKEKYKDIELHLIGPLQSRKASNALKIFDVIQSIDREKLVKEIVKKRDVNSITKSFYIQLNIGAEEQKSGLKISLAKDFYYYCLDQKLSILGFMCIPPNDENPKKYFLEMIRIRNLINSDLLLSMGMSGDYEVALDNESDVIRIGSSLFYE